MEKCKCGTVFDWKSGLAPDQVGFVETNPVKVLVSRCDNCNAEVEVNTG